jgi:hypothetical protein
MQHIPSTFIILLFCYFVVSFFLVSSLSTLPLNAMTFVLTVQMLKLCSSPTNVYTRLCVRVLYAITQFWPLIRSGVTLFRNGSMVDIGDLLLRWWESPCRCNHAPDWFQRHLHKSNMMTLDLQCSLFQRSFIALSLSSFLDVCHYFYTYSSSPFLFIFSYPIPLNGISTHPAERTVLGPEFGYHDLSVAQGKYQNGATYSDAARVFFHIPCISSFKKHSNMLHCKINEQNIQLIILK